LLVQAKRLLKDRRGISEYVAAASLIPVLMLLFAMAIQLTVLGVLQLAVNEAAFEAARAAARSPTPYATAVQTAQNFAKGFILGWKDKVRVTMVQTPNKPGDPVTVQVSFPVPQFFSALQTKTVYGSSTQIWEERP
jgi:Flp pilus assembly protein TadG